MSSWDKPEWDEDVMVTINGKQYRTNLYDGVQRFVPDMDVLKMMDLAMKHFGLHGRAGTFFGDKIPESLQGGTHPNAVVNYIVERNNHSYFGLNELAVALHNEEVELEDYIEFETLHGWSISGYYDTVTSKLSNLDLGEVYEDEEDGEEYEDFSAVFTLSNPNWEE